MPPEIRIKVDRQIRHQSDALATDEAVHMRKMCRLYVYQ